MRKYFTIGLIGLCVGLLSLTIVPKKLEAIGVESTLNYFKQQSVSFAQSTADLQEKIRKIKDSDPSKLASAKGALKKCRLQYKNIEFFLNYFFSTVAIIYNAPPVPEAEEPFLEYRDPTGLQVIEQLLFSAKPEKQKKEMLQQVSLIRTAAEDLNSLLYNLPIDDAQILESIRLELISVMTQGIAGFDAPELKTGISEAKQVLTAFQLLLSPYLDTKGRMADSVTYYLNAAVKRTGNSNFNSFDRLDFLTNAALPFEHYLNLFIRENGFGLNTVKALNYEADNLFDPRAIIVNDNREISPALVALGRKLFFETVLSGNNSRSCATCHQPEKYFTDGLTKSITMDGVSTVKRNAPTLLYSAFQYSQFWDGSVKNFEDQVKTVLRNPIEMNADHVVIVKRLKDKEHYVHDFNGAFPGNKEQDAITIDNVVLSISAFLKTLAPFDSPFDRYIRGDNTAMNPEQKKGFNLFMGKALCGTCHTAPLFNGLTPPLYNKTSLEVVGTTTNINFKSPHLDPDSGRYATYRLAFLKGAFKTPGLRDIAKTAPYMHNGQFPTLESVLDFYNKGGGQGMGLKVPNQTLSSTPLKLTKEEIRSIIAFFQSLTDSSSSLTEVKQRAIN
ncbi:MAG: cytochrome-c peroxidase [Chitinophagales bacterium]